MHGILEQGGADAATLPRGADRHAGQEHDRDRMTSQPLAQPPGSIVEGDLPDDQGIIADDRLPGQDDISLGVAGLLVHQGEPREEPVQLLTPAIEAVDGVVAHGVLDPYRLGHSRAPRDDARLSEQPLQARQIARRRVEGLEEGLPLIGVQHEAGAIGQRLLRADQRTFRARTR